MGWTPEVTWATPVPQLLLALDGKMEFVAKTNPFGAVKKKPTKEQQAKIQQQRDALNRVRLDLRAKRNK